MRPLMMEVMHPPLLEINFPTSVFSNIIEYLFGFIYIYSEFIFRLILTEWIFEEYEQ